MMGKQVKGSGNRQKFLGLAVGLLLPLFADAQIVLTDDSLETNSLSAATVTMTGRSELHITDSGTPLSGNTINLDSVDSWVFVHEVVPSTVISSYLSQFKVSGANAVNSSNVKVVQYGQGAVVIPYPSDFQPLEVFDGENFSGDSTTLSPNTSYGALLGGKISSFVLKRGYTATLAENSNGTGLSVNYVAADGDLRLAALPDGLNNHVYFIRVYPWHWVSKKGSCDIAPLDLDAKWYYNWNVTWQAANPDYEYVAIKQQRWWPGLPNPGDAGYLGVNHVSGYNEPNNPVEDAYTSLNNGDVATAVGAWGELEGTGLRIGAPAVTDGGRSWIIDFMNQAEAAGRRVDYVPIHYYRASDNTAWGAQNSLYWYLKDIYDQFHKPIWLTEFNNGANWTGGAPTFNQNRDCVEAMINMMDDAPWVERYSVYSAVEEVRQVYYNAGGYTPMGQMYKDHISPMGYQQILPGEGMDPSASYYFENNLDDASGSGNHAVSHDYPDIVVGHTNTSTALAFDGVDDHVILPDSLSDGTDFTFAAWIYWNGGDAWQRIFDFGILDSGNTYMFLTPSGDGTMKFDIRNSSAEQVMTTSALPLDTWTHVAVTLSGDTGRMYVNGAQVAQNTSMTLNPSDLGAIQHYLGRSMWPNDPYFSGKIDDVLVNDQALSAAQIAALMTNQPPQASTNLVDGGTIDKDVAYTNSVAGIATDPEGGPVAYSKVYGPAWLSMAPDGTATGTPTGTVQGDQIFTVRATDAAGASTYFILKIGLITVPVNFTTGPLAHWDFNDPSLGAANGAAVPDSDGYVVWREAATDKAGNGNHLTTWDWSGAGFNWSSSSQQGDFSIIAVDQWPAAYTWSAKSEPAGIDVETAVMTNFTVEALATTAGSGYRTVVGRDAQYVATGNGDYAAFYLGLTDASHPRVIMVDENGVRVEIVATGITVANDSATWYHLAAVKKGDMLFLYVNGSLAASTNVGGLGALSVGSSSGSGWHAGGWSVGRGLWAGGHTDRWFGHIDEVAISGVALEPGSFVITGAWPEPYTFYFDDYGIPGAAFEGDANSNGVPNGMEYYLGRDPASPGATNEFLRFSDDYLSVLHPYNPLASGVTGAVEWATDLVAGKWSAAGVSYVTNSAPDEIEAILGSSTTNQLFIRLKVDH